MAKKKGGTLIMNKTCLKRFLALVLVALSLFTFTSSLAECEDDYCCDEYDDFYADGFGEDEFIMLIRDILGYVPQMHLVFEDGEKPLMVLDFPGNMHAEFPVEITEHGIKFYEEDYLTALVAENIYQHRMIFYTAPGTNWYLFDEGHLINDSLGFEARKFSLIKGSSEKFFLSFKDEIIVLYEDDVSVISEDQILVSGEALSRVVYNWNMR